MAPRLGDARRRGALLAVALAATLALAFVSKDACFGDRERGFQLRGLCYSDIGFLYFSRNLQLDPVPFRAYPEHDARNPNHDPNRTDSRIGFLEYPVVLGYVVWFAGQLSTSDPREVGLQAAAREFFVWNAVLLAIAAAAVLLLLRRLEPDGVRLSWWVASPLLVLYAFHNWDLVALALLVLGLLWWRRERWLLSGLAMGLGAATKFFPLLVSPALLVWLVRGGEETGPRAWFRPEVLRFCAGVAGGIVAAHVPVLLYGDLDLLVGSFLFQAQRDPNLESVGWLVQYAAARVGQPVGAEAISTVLMLGFLALATFTLARAWTHRLPWTHSAWALLTAFFLFNRFSSVQYALWFLPLFVLVRFRPTFVHGFLLLNVALVATLLPAHAVLMDVASTDPAELAVDASFTPAYAPVGLFVALRALFQAAIVMALLGVGPFTRVLEAPRTPHVWRTVPGLTWGKRAGAVLAVATLTWSVGWATLELPAMATMGAVFVCTFACLAFASWRGLPLGAATAPALLAVTAAFLAAAAPAVEGSPLPVSEALPRLFVVAASFALLAATRLFFQGAAPAPECASCGGTAEGTRCVSCGRSFRLPVVWRPGGSL